MFEQVHCHCTAVVGRRVMLTYTRRSAAVVGVLLLVVASLDIVASSCVDNDGPQVAAGGPSCAQLLSEGHPDPEFLDTFCGSSFGQEMCCFCRPPQVLTIADVQSALPAMCKVIAGYVHFGRISHLRHMLRL